MVMDDLDVSDDSISITSTVASDKEESYEVESILAEKESNGGTVYLTAWKGYPETEHLWLPKENFNEDDIFIDWLNTKTRRANGLEKPFDVRAWEKRCRAISVATSRRKERRRLKRLRLSKQGKSTSSSREQDGNIQGSGSNSAPQRSNKRIKRRTVHQDSPPSSLTSTSTSSSSSEDSDRPLVSRQESETFVSNPKWTQAETIAFEEGLRKVEGPHWREILGLYGRRGKVNQLLKDRTPGDLYDKAKSLRQEFVDSGREPPDYLKPFTKQDSNKGSRPSTPNVSSESRNQSRAASKKGSRSTSMDSTMVELQRKLRVQEAENRGNSRLQKKTHMIETSGSVGGQEQPSTSAKQMSGDKSKASETSQKPARKEKMTHANKAICETQAGQSNSRLTKATPQTEAITPAREISNNDSHQRTQPEDGPRVKHPSQTSAAPQIERQTESEAPGGHETTKPTTDDAAQPESSHMNVPENSEATRGETGRNKWSGTARTPTARPSLSNKPRQGAVESSSTRQSSMKTKPKLGQIEPKIPSKTGDVTATWNTEPKRRKSNNWATENADPMEGQPKNRSYKLSVQNKIFRSRRDGRPPDPSRLVFIDPKTGKAPTTVPTPSTPAVLFKSPLQLHQEELTAREAEEIPAREIEDAMTTSTNKHDQLPQAKEQSSKASPDKHKILDTEKRILTTSESVLGPTTGDMIDRPSHTNRPMPPGPTSPHPEAPINAPSGPRIQTKRLASMSLHDYTKRTIPNPDPVNEAVISTNRSHSSDDPSKFILRVNPSEEHQNELFKQKEQDLVLGEIKIGKDDGEGIKVKFVGFGFEVKQLLLAIKVLPRTLNFVFESFCLASEYKAYFPAEPSDYLGSGSIVPYPHSASAIENIVEKLANNLEGGLFFTQHFTMLMYPACASAWAFLDKDLPSVHPGTVLRFAVRKPLKPAVADVHRPTTARLMTEEPEQYADITNKIQKYPIQPKDKNINIVFHDMFDIDFDRLIAQNGDQQHPPTKIFFLCFIPQGCEVYEPDAAKRSALHVRTSQEHDLFVKFLQANGAEEIYSMQKIGSQELDSNGGWDYFYKNVKSGTIIFHDAMIRYDLMPHLGQHLLHGSVNVWKTSLSPMHPGEKHPHLVRLFPHGGVLLLTESLLLYRPHESLRLLMWFRRVHVPTKAPGTWKIAVRPRIREWLLDILDAYSSSGKDIFGYGMQIFANIYTEIYWLLQNPNPGNSGLMCHEWDYELPTDEAPIVSSSSLRALQARKEWQGEGADTRPNDEHIRQNDNLLAQWFAEWAIVNLDSFRKFNIILGYTEDHPFTNTAISAYEEQWGHLQVMTFEQACKRHKVTPQSKLDDMEAERRRKLKEQLPAKKAAAEKARKEERQAARLALEARMQTYRDGGCTEEEARKAGRELLRHLGASEAEVEACRVDMDRVFGDRWWEGDMAEADSNQMDTT